MVNKGFVKWCQLDILWPMMGRVGFNQNLPQVHRVIDPILVRRPFTSAKSNIHCELFAE